jgi:hypothetical protein
MRPASTLHAECMSYRMHVRKPLHFRSAASLNFNETRSAIEAGNT